MTLPTAAKQQLVQKLRQNAGMVWSIVHEFRGLRHEWDAGGYSSALIDSDVSLVAPGLTAADIVSLVTSLTVISDTLTDGHDTNLAVAKS